MVYMVAIQFVSGVPHPGFFESTGETDQLKAVISRVLFSPGEIGTNLLHLPMFSLLAWMWCWALECYFKRPRTALTVALAVSLLFGVLNEMSQALVPTRWATVNDALANSLGVLVGAALYWRIRRPTEAPGSRKE